MNQIKKEDSKHNFFTEDYEDLDFFHKINWNQFYSLKNFYSNMFFQNIIYLIEDKFSWKNSLSYEIENNKAIVEHHYMVDISDAPEKFIEKGFYNKKNLYITKNNKIDFYLFLMKNLKPYYGTLFINNILNDTIHNIKFKDKHISFQNFKFPYFINPKNFKEDVKILSEQYSQLKKMHDILLYKQFFIDIEKIMQESDNILNIELFLGKNTFNYKINLKNKEDSLILDINSLLEKYKSKEDDLLKIKNIDSEHKITITDNFQERFKSYHKIISISIFNFFFFPVFKIENKDYFTNFINYFQRVKEKEVLLKSIPQNIKTLRIKRKRI